VPCGLFHAWRAGGLRKVLINEGAHIPDVH
jgi:hypothetical protein